MQRVRVTYGTGAVAREVDTGFPLPVTDLDPELLLASGMTSLRDKQVAQRYTSLADSIADGLNAFWTISNANGGSASVVLGSGEGLVQSSTASNGMGQLVSTPVLYYPGQVGWFNSAIRAGDTGVIGNVRRWGTFTVAGGVPQDGYYYELNGTTFSAVSVKGGTATPVASTAWTKFSTAPFTLDLNFHSFEIRFTANSVLFYIDNVLRHNASGGPVPITGTLNFPMAIHSINTTSVTNCVIGVRNVGMGRFGTPDVQPVSLAGTSKVVFDQTTPGGNQVVAQLVRSTPAEQSLVELMTQLNGSMRAAVYLLTQLVAIERGLPDPRLGEEADDLIGEFLKPANDFVNLIN